MGAFGRGHGYAVGNDFTGTSSFRIKNIKVE
jgi:hypothetical protein